MPGPAIKGLGFGDDPFSQSSGLGSIKQKGLAELKILRLVHGDIHWDH